MTLDEFNRWRRLGDAEMRVDGAVFIPTHVRSGEPPALCGKMWKSVEGHPCGGTIVNVEVAIEYIALHPREDRSKPPPGYFVRDQWWSTDKIKWWSDGFGIDPVGSAWRHHDSSASVPPSNHLMPAAKRPA